MDCYVAAPNYEAALRLAVEKLAAQGYVFDDVLGGQVHQLDPSKWDEFILHRWQEFSDHFPPQSEMEKFMAENAVIFGPFCGWE